MKKIRLYQNTLFKVGDKVSLEKNNGHHLLKVLRFPIGSTITLFNGDGFDYQAIVISTKKTFKVELVSQQKNENELLPAGNYALILSRYIKTKKIGLVIHFHFHR